MAKKKTVNGIHHHPDADFPWEVWDVEGEQTHTLVNTESNYQTRLPKFANAVDGQRMVELLDGVYGVSREAPPIVEKTYGEALGMLYAVWFTLMAIKAKQERTGEGLYAVAEMFDKDGKPTVPNLQPEHWHGYFEHIMTACYLGVISEAKTIITVPRHTAEWFGRYSKDFNGMSEEDKRAALAELYGERVKIL